jgi:methionyl-tRNA synthetase
MCADDTHGTAIMISARDQGISEEELIDRMHGAHLHDFNRFDIEFDNYGSTHSEENRGLCAEFWDAIRKADLVVEKEVTQLYDPKAETFLADRFVRGTCPFCKLPDQYGDSCDNGHTYSPKDLIDPVSTLSGATPEVRSSQHLFVEIEQLQGFLEDWTQKGDRLQPEVANYLSGHFLCEPLRDWDISRPAPYFGFEIPDSPGNYWYVWFDAPIGYMASTKEWCQRVGENFDDWWRNDRTEIHHFIGKDITYFHTLFWPAMLKTAGFNLPTKVHIHGFLTVDGQKMSKSKGTYIRASTYLEHLDPSYLRYYYASKLPPRVDDIDLNFDEFVAKINADLVGNVVNLASRTAKFAHGTGLAEKYPDDGGLFEQAAKDGNVIAEAYETCDYNKAMRVILEASDRANQFVERAAPWNLRKDPKQIEPLRDVCTIGLNLFRQVAIYLSPVLPQLAKQTGELLNQPIQHWDESKTPLLGKPVNRFQHMMTRVRTEEVEAVIQASKEPDSDEADDSTIQWQDSGEPLEAEPLADTISFDEFLKVDLRVARVLAAEDVAEARKLMKFTLSLGGDQRRTVFAGIKGVYQPEDLVGRLVVCAANLAPRKMKFGTSEGMILASGPGGNDIFLLYPDEGAKPGQRVH